MTNPPVPGEPLSPQRTSAPAGLVPRPLVLLPVAVAVVLAALTLFLAFGS